MSQRRAAIVGRCPITPHVNERGAIDSSKGNNLSFALQGTALSICVHPNREAARIADPTGGRGEFRARDPEKEAARNKTLSAPRTRHRTRTAHTTHQTGHTVGCRRGARAERMSRPCTTTCAVPPPQPLARTPRPPLLLCRSPSKFRCRRRRLAPCRSRCRRPRRSRSCRLQTPRPRASLCRR